MKCIKCQMDLPDTAKFCPACGTKQGQPAAPPPAPAPAAPAGGTVPMQAAVAPTPAAPPPVASPAAPAPAPRPATRPPAPAVSPPVAAPPPAAPAPAPRPATRPPAPVAPPVAAAPPPAAPEPPPPAPPPPAPPPPASPPAQAQEPAPAAGAEEAAAEHNFTFTADDLDRALSFACARAHLDKPEHKLPDVAAYYSAGKDLKIDRAHLEASLHAVAVEKMQGVSMGETGRGAAAEIFRVHTVDSIPLPDLVPKKDKTKAAILAVVAFVLLAVGVIFAALYVDYLDEKKIRDEKARTEAATPKEPPAPKGKIDVEAFRSAVEAVNAKVKTCCDAELKEKIAEQTSISVSARIGMDGAASNIKIVKDPLDNAVVRGCIEKEVAGHSFVKPEGEPVDVDFSLIFEPAPKAPEKPKGKKKR
ncbi:MAG: AgmX/PglI C-terminal domain-containing protein [Pseudomonadota bacterium]